MIYLIGGAPRSGKTILAQRVAASLGIGWFSTDLAIELLRAKNVPGTVEEWDADPAAIAEAAAWFAPCLERLVWGLNALSESYVLEGVWISPGQVATLATIAPVRALFLGCQGMTLERLDAHPGQSRGYATLPASLRERIARDVPRWSAYVATEAARHDQPYLDTTVDFATRLTEGEDLLTDGAASEG